MKLNKVLLAYARREVDQHILPDLLFASQLHGFLQQKISLQEYLQGESGFKRFLYDYRVGRTLQAGDDAKVAMLKTILKFSFSPSPVSDITSLALLFQSKQFSTQSVNSNHGLPQSFASKLMSVYKPDAIIPYDSYALKSINRNTGKKLKELAHYYQAVEDFRLEFFPVDSKEVKRIKLSEEKTVLKLMDKLRLDPDKVLSWKLTDKYLWCEEAARRTEQRSKE